MAIKDLVSKTVNEHQGIKATELVVLVVQQCSEFPFKHEEFENAVSELVEEGEIVELEYTLPSMDYRVKSYYLPKGTVIEVSKAS